MSSIQRDGYIELASPQLLDDKWRELSFDLAPSHNTLQDCIVPESGSGYVYRDAKSVGSATHNRYIYWKTSNDVLELIEMSTETNLEDNQVRIRFVNSPIVDNITVIEFSESIAIMLATLTSVHRVFLPHPKTTNRSVFSNLTSDILFDPANYYLFGNQNNSNPNQPICATAWYDNSFLKCALSFPDSSMLIVQFGYETHHISTSEIKQTGIIGRLWSKMPNFWAKSPEECDNTIFACVPFIHHETNDVLLITLCRDCRIRIFSVNSRECVCSFNMIPQTSFHQSFAAHTNPSNEVPKIKIIDSYIIIYLSENKPEFVFLEHNYTEGNHELRECVTLQAPDWSNLIDFGVTTDKIWALADMCETETVMCYLSRNDVINRGNADASLMDGQWEYVNLSDTVEPVNSKSMIAEIFWRNRFSLTSVQKALIGIIGPSVPRKYSMEGLEELATTRIVSDNRDSAWTRFFEYCLQNHLKANRCIGLILSDDESIIGLVKRSNPSFICPWPVNDDVFLQDSPYRGLEFPRDCLRLVESLNSISSNLLSDDMISLIEEKLQDSPSEVISTIHDVVNVILSKQKTCPFNMSSFNRMTAVSGIDCIIGQLDLTEAAQQFNNQLLSEYKTKIRSEYNPLGSYSGMIVTYEFFRIIIKSRFILTRDLLLYICLLTKYDPEDKSILGFCEELYLSGRVRRLLDAFRSYSTMIWLSDAPIKNHTMKPLVALTDHVAKHFEFFKRVGVTNYHSPNSILEQSLQQNLLTYFLSEGGTNFHWLVSDITKKDQSLSKGSYLNDTTLSLCKLLWPKSSHVCIEEFMLTHHLDEHLAKYSRLTRGWVDCCEPDRYFIDACNCMLRNRANQSVEIFNRLWTSVTRTNIIGRFLELDTTSGHEIIAPNQGLIERYFAKLIQLFEIYGNRQCLVSLINSCMSLLQANADGDQQTSMNTLRAKLFQYYLELEDPDEAYHTMVLTTDSSLRINCLRKFIVSHCEKQQWINLLTYPFIDIKHDFIDILSQKADSLDLSALNPDDFYKTSYYDLLFASYVMDDDYKQAAEIMYNYSQRLAQEVPGKTSIMKQVDCLLIALNSLRCVDERERFIECKQTTNACNGRASILKRSYDCESIVSSQGSHHDQIYDTDESKVFCQDIKKKYELTKARLKLLEKDQVSNAIALSPLKPEEIIQQLVSSSLYATAMDLALLFRTSMEPIMEGLTSKYILVMRLSSADILVYQEVERALSDLFMSSYSNIDTYNYVANSTNPLIDRVWRLIDHYLMAYDGVSHRYKSPSIADESAATTVLMRVCALKLLSAGYEVPASLRLLYIQRNAAELLKLLIKYDRLVEATELAVEMIDRVLEPANCLTVMHNNQKVMRPPIYLPTHLILLLISYLNEDATDINQLKLANILSDRLNKFRNFIKVQ